MKKSILFLIFFTLHQSFVLAQSESGNSEFQKAYSAIIHQFPDIYIGGQYAQPHRNLDGHPFFDSPTFEDGTIRISGFQFDDIPLQYDLTEDILITFIPTHRRLTILNHHKIDRFSFTDGAVFVKKDNVANHYYHKNGYYREIVKDKIGLYCKHFKLIQKRTSIFEMALSLSETTRFFIEKDGALHWIKKPKDAFNLLNITKKEVRPLLKKERLRYKKHKEAYLKVLVETANNRDSDEI